MKPIQHLHLTGKKICGVNAEKRPKSGKNKCFHPEPKNESFVHSYVIENVIPFFPVLQGQHLSETQILAFTDLDEVSETIKRPFMEMNKECIYIFIRGFLSDSVPNQQSNICFYICMFQ